MAYNEMESLKQELESLSKVASDGLQPVISLAGTIQNTLAESVKSTTPAMSAFTGAAGDGLAATCFFSISPLFYLLYIRDFWERGGGRPSLAAKTA